MASSDPVRILVVTDRTAASAELRSEIAERARRGPVRVRVLVPTIRWTRSKETLHDEPFDGGRGQD
jgi:hypothetical protein